MRRHGLLMAVSRKLKLIWKLIRLWFSGYGQGGVQSYLKSMNQSFSLFIILKFVILKTNKQVLKFFFR